MYTIATIIGSLRQGSMNKQLFHAIDKLDHPQLTFQPLKIDDIPLFNQDNENNMPFAVAQFKKAVKEADGVLFVTPEYNRSIPGVLKNVIDWGTRPYGQNVWVNKPTAMLGTSPGAIGTAISQSHLRSVMVSLGVILMGQPEVYLVFKEGLMDDKGNITNDGTKQFLQNFLDTFSAWVQQHRAA